MIVRFVAGIHSPLAAPQSAHHRGHRHGVRRRHRHARRHARHRRQDQSRTAPEGANIVVTPQAAALTGGVGRSPRPPRARPTTSPNPKCPNQEDLLGPEHHRLLAVADRAGRRAAGPGRLVLASLQDARRPHPDHRHRRCQSRLADRQGPLDSGRSRTSASSAQAVARRNGWKPGSEITRVRHRRSESPASSPPAKKPTIASSSRSRACSSSRRRPGRSTASTSRR